MRRYLPLLVLAMLGGCGSPPPQIDLLIPVNAKCTTCEDFIRCDAGAVNPAIYDPTFDVYRLEPKGTLAQLATVWEFLIQLFHTRTEDFRPLSIYSQRPGTVAPFERTITGDVEARTDLVQHRIHVPKGWIDQATGERYDTDDQRRGSCRLLKPAEGRELLKLFTEPVSRSSG